MPYAVSYAVSPDSPNVNICERTTQEAAIDVARSFAAIGPEGGLATVYDGETPVVCFEHKAGNIERGECSVMPAPRNPGGAK